MAKEIVSASDATENLTDLGADIAKSAAEKVAEGLGAPKGWLQGVSFGGFFGFSVFWAIAASPELGPFICLCLGSMAIAIAVQQIYLSWASKDEKSRYLYFWGAAALICLGLSSAFASLQSPSLKLEITNQLMRAFPSTLFCIGVFCLYRFVILFLFRKDYGQVIEHSLFSIFTDKAPKSAIVDQAMFWATLVLILAWIPASGHLISQDKDPATFFVEGYTSVSKLMGVIVLIFLSVSYLMSVTYFIKKIRSIQDGQKIDETLRFFQCMIKTFYILTIAQFTFMAIHFFDEVTDDGISYISDFANGSLFFMGVFVIAIPVGFLAKYKNTARAPLFLSMLTVMFPIGVACMIRIGFPDLQYFKFFENIPMPYATLGFLTLGFAFLPANDLVNLRDGKT